MKSLVYSLLCFITCVTIIFTGFFIVDKSFNAMVKGRDDFMMVRYVYNEDDLVGGEIMNEYFGINLNTYSDIITQTKEVFLRNE